MICLRLTKKYLNSKKIKMLRVEGTSKSQITHSFYRKLVENCKKHLLCVVCEPYESHVIWGLRLWSLLGPCYGRTNLKSTQYNYGCS